MEFSIQLSADYPDKAYGGDRVYRDMLDQALELFGTPVDWCCDSAQQAPMFCGRPLHRAADSALGMHAGKAGEAGH